MCAYFGVPNHKTYFLLLLFSHKVCYNLLIWYYFPECHNVCACLSACARVSENELERVPIFQSDTHVRDGDVHLFHVLVHMLYAQF